MNSHWLIQQSRVDGELFCQVTKGRSSHGTGMDLAAAKARVKSRMDKDDRVFLVATDGYRTDITREVSGAKRRGWRA